MAFSHGSQARLLCNGFDLSAWFRSASTPVEVGEAEGTTFGNEARVFQPGLVTARLDAEGLFEADEAGHAVEPVLNAALRLENRVWLYCPAGYALGARAVGMASFITGLEKESPVDDLVSLTVGVRSQVGHDAGVVLHPLGAESAADEGPSVDTGITGLTFPTSAGAVAYVMATEPGTQPVTVRVQHSADEQTWADLLTFTAIPSTGRVAERQTVAPGTPVNRYVRAAWTATGTTPPFIVMFARRFAAN